MKVRSAHTREFIRLSLIVNTSVEERREAALEPSYERRRAPWRALVRWDAGRPQVNGIMCEWGGGSVGMWGDENDVIPKACSIWLFQILSNSINALDSECNWCIICESYTQSATQGTCRKDGRSFYYYHHHHLQSLLIHFSQIRRLGQHRT